MTGNWFPQDIEPTCLVNCQPTLWWLEGVGDANGRGALLLHFVPCVGGAALCTSMRAICAWASSLQLRRYHTNKMPVIWFTWSILTWSVKWSSQGWRWQGCSLRPPKRMIIVPKHGRQLHWFRALLVAVVNAIIQSWRLNLCYRSNSRCTQWPQL